MFGGYDPVEFLGSTRKSEACTTGGTEDHRVNRFYERRAVRVATLAGEVFHLLFVNHGDAQFPGLVEF
jgi:hypothetical protein